MVKFCGKLCCKHFIARIDVIDHDDYKEIFLKRIVIKNASIENAIFVPEPDEVTFPKDDVMGKLTKPVSTGSSSRTHCQLCFKENLSQ